MWDLSKEEYFWDLVKGIGLWPRWYLTAFKGFYGDENPKEQKAVKMKRYRRKLAKAKKRATLEGVRKRANDSELFQDDRERS